MSQPQCVARCTSVNMCSPFSLLALICAVGAVSGYVGSDNRVAPSTSRESIPDLPWPPPQIEYHYPDDIRSNHIVNPPSQPYNARSQPINRLQHEARWRHRAFNPSQNSTNQRIKQRTTTGLFRSSQWGTVRIPYPGATVNMPVLAGSNKAYRGTITTTVLAPSQTHKRVNLAEGGVQYSHGEGLAVHDEPAMVVACVRCPSDRAVVASRGANFVLVEQPALKACHHRAKVPGVTMETLFGPQPGTMAPEGSHLIIIRVYHLQKQIKTCQFRYNVIVRRCPPLVPSEHLRVRCSHGNLWGSECQLICRQGYQRQGRGTTECGDKLRWTNPLPQCAAVTECTLPMSPEHGHLSCETTPGSNTDLLPEGSICRYNCKEGYFIPRHQSHLINIRCRAGEWNSTADPSCIDGSGTLPLEEEQVKPEVLRSNKLQRSGRHKHRGQKQRKSRSQSRNDPCRPNPCQGGGTCLRGPHSRPLLCICRDHREGEFCERARCQKEMCQNGGRCVLLGDQSVCYCPPGFSGPNCQEQDLR